MAIKPYNVFKVFRHAPGCGHINGFYYTRMYMRVRNAKLHFFFNIYIRLTLDKHEIFHKTLKTI